MLADAILRPLKRLLRRGLSQAGFQVVRTSTLPLRCFHDIKRLRRQTGRQASLFFDVGANVGQTKPRPHGAICSMSRSGNVWDNAAMESFFSSLKTERTGRKTYRTRDEARADVFDYIERFYNHKRRHSKIGFMSPLEFERQAGLA
jgi:putative transposase